MGMPRVPSDETLHDEGGKWVEKLRSVPSPRYSPPEKHIIHMSFSFGFSQGATSSICAADLIKVRSSSRISDNFIE